ncbi:MAG TPA: phosphate ABC transporter permease PstA [Anaerolineales bacterium]|nr:phosphate ABC transporter permease PstA [Anaerolineales bacterium]
MNLLRPRRGFTETQEQLATRHSRGKLVLTVFQFATLMGVIVLVVLLLTIINNSFGYSAVENKVDPENLTVNGVPLEGQTKEQLVAALQQNVSAGLFARFEHDQPIAERDAANIYDLIQEYVISPEVVESWNFYDSLTRKDEILVLMQERYPNAELQFLSWVNWDFVRSQQSSHPEIAGVRTAILGSVWTISIAIFFSLPVGVAAAVYLQEYAADNFINRIIQTNINNLAGVPSIIYGILGLAIFVRAFAAFTSGIAFGAADPSTANGRTIISAGLTLGVLVLPLIIINAQEAIKAVPNSLREASFGIGATRWETVWSHVLPNAVAGILTGSILAVSRAIGETAPLVVIGASTFIQVDPEGPFSKFTTLPAQIYQWTVRPQGAFHNIAAAASLVLLILLLALNATAIVLRNRYSRRL